MRISIKAEYALEAVFDLALQNSAGPIRIADIAKRQKIPQKFLELILAGLKQGGFVESRRGAEGGYMLARRAEAITVGEVLRFVEGSDVKPRGKRRADTPFTEMWRAVDESVSAIIDHTNFAELARNWGERQRQYVANWEI
jgi:Rrf2 family transcriptional regulator, cysteine metabolism repressor